ncbi:MAG: hypothetical protein ABIR26_17170 [Ramlibacter sp.]
MLKRWLSYPFVQIALCVAVYAFVGWRMGPFALVIGSPLLAAAIAFPLLTLIANFRHDVRARAWLPVHGQHYVFKGITIHVLEDDDCCRWISLADMQKVAGVTAKESVLATVYPERCKRLGKSDQPHLRDDAVIEHLGKVNNAVALRFRTWVEREIAYSARRIRKSKGIRPEPAYAD